VAFAETFQQFFVEKIANIRRAIDSRAVNASTCDRQPREYYQHAQLCEFTQATTTDLRHRFAVACEIMRPRPDTNEPAKRKYRHNSISLYRHRQNVPAATKHATVTPILKKRGLDVNSLANYRPISMLRHGVLLVLLDAVDSRHGVLLVLVRRAWISGWVCGEAWGPVASFWGGPGGTRGAGPAFLAGQGLRARAGEMRYGTRFGAVNPASGKGVTGPGIPAPRGPWDPACGEKARGPFRWEARRGFGNPAGWRGGLTLFHPVNGAVPWFPPLFKPGGPCRGPLVNGGGRPPVSL
ncbi:hypothetical protein NP493_2150g00004, partial [Ridgeia piscesae]